MKKRRVTSKDIAQAAGTSQATVSYVLNERMDISIPNETRKHIFDVAHQLGYRPNRIARSLISGKTQTIGVILNALGVEFEARIMFGIDKVCSENEYRMIISNASRSATSLSNEVMQLLEQRVDGVIYIPDNCHFVNESSWLDELLDESVPCVLVDARAEGLRVDSVYSDDIAGARMAVEHLLSKGNKRIAFLHQGLCQSTIRDRLEGYRRAIEAAGIDYDESLVVEYPFGGDIELIKSLIDMSSPVTAIFAVSDTLIPDIMPFLRKLGIHVPQDIALVGYSNSLFAKALGLTSVDQYPERMGVIAMQRLLERVKDYTLAPKELVVPTDLVIRESTDIALS